MDDYRSLSEDEITQLEEQGCTAEDWTAISVDENFQPLYVINVCFYGEVNLGLFDKNIEVDEGFFKHSGIRNAVLKDVSVGDNTLIEGVGNYIHNYDIGEECYISNIGKMSNTPDAVFGEGNVISVKDESGDGNVVIFSALSSQLAALMVINSGKAEFQSSMRDAIKRYVESQKPERGIIGYRVKIVNTVEITNAIINDDCEISGASRISDCSILSTPEASCFIGNNVIIDNSIVQAGSSILDGAIVSNCFIGEACHIGKGASAETSLFFANSYLDNGEACAAFCGPFSVSHHKSSLLIGGEYSFYNAGSNTNFSNHAYKMGPIHHGTMNRGAKTASGAHILWPATIGAFSMCMGKIESHPDSDSLPFSYLFGKDSKTTLIPGRNIATVGTYRDIHKWVKRDMRSHINRLSLINFNWLNPVVIADCLKAKGILMRLCEEQGDDAEEYTYNGCIIPRRSLLNGIHYYDMAISLYLGEITSKYALHLPTSCIGTEQWVELSGMVAPESEIEEITNEITSGELDDFIQITKRMATVFQKYDEYEWNFAYHFISDYYKLDTVTDEDIQRINNEYEKYFMEWITLIKEDAKKEYDLGDVKEDALDEFLNSIDETSQNKIQ